MLDAGRIRLVSEKLQAFYVYNGVMKRSVDFFLPERATYESFALLKLSCKGFAFFIFFVRINQYVRPTTIHNLNKNKIK